MELVSNEESRVSTLSVRAMGCNPSKVKTLKPEEGKEGNKLVLLLCRFYGKVKDVKYRDNRDRGDMSAVFAGTFEGVNLQDGKVLRSSKLLLPKGISEVVEAALKEAHAKDDKASITFAFDLSSVKTTNQMGYRYEAAALKQPQAEDELAALRETITAKFPLDHKAMTVTKTGGTPVETTAHAKKKSA